MRIYKDIKKLSLYGISKNMIKVDDLDYIINKISNLLELEMYIDNDIEYQDLDEPSLLLEPILDFAQSKDIISPNTAIQRDLFESKIMDIFMSKPSDIQKEFFILHEKHPNKATEFFYKLSQNSNYIKTNRIAKNVNWEFETKYGFLDLTVNLSKPEKDPRDIISFSKKTNIYYPKCFLCKENVGFYGNNSHPGRTSHRIIKLDLNHEEFYFQYSPYVYYNEHCIIFKSDHIPMKINESTFIRLLDFIDLFPDYFLGSNAGLPIVGGSILNHEHYQGGRHSFPIEKAKVIDEFKVDSITIKRLLWPLSVIRLESNNKYDIIKYANKLRLFWENYTNKNAGIYAYTDALHNAVTPIARKFEDKYVLDIALRNNLTSTTYPLGIFHPHPENQHIKKENIGLVEVMGLGVLPPRLDDELKIIKKYLKKPSDFPQSIKIHENWVNYLQNIYDGSNIDNFINQEVGIKFLKCIEDAGVFKQTASGEKQFSHFIKEFIDSL